jgi:hypothetical protein
MQLNAKEGSRSEILADYWFSRWGAVTPVRRSDDFGIDLYCTLFDEVGKSAVVRDYFSVQVKSGLIPWNFTAGDQVRWLVEYPTPLFLACVDKKKLTVSIHHAMIRFLLRAFASRKSPSVLLRRSVGYLWAKRRWFGWTSKAPISISGVAAVM